jgi:hypothetical protein
MPNNNNDHDHDNKTGSDSVNNNNHNHNHNHNNNENSNERVILPNHDTATTTPTAGTIDTPTEILNPYTNTPHIPMNTNNTDQRTITNNDSIPPPNHDAANTNPTAGNTDTSNEVTTHPPTTHPNNYNANITTQVHLTEPYDLRAKAWGDTITLPRPDKTIRLICQNINGLSTNIAEQTSTLDALHALDPSVIGLIVTNLDWKCYERVQHYTLLLFRQVWRTTRLTTACGQETDKSMTTLPGGVLQASVGHLCARVRSTLKDPSGMGRWTGQILHGSNGVKLVILSAYRVYQVNPMHAGHTTSVMQQWRHMRAAGITEPNPTAQFIDDLICEINRLGDDDHEITVMLDANESISSQTMQRLIDACELFDFHHPTQENPHHRQHTTEELPKLIICLAPTSYSWHSITVVLSTSPKGPLPIIAYCIVTLTKNFCLDPELSILLIRNYRSY